MSSSSREVEYVALAEAVKTAICLRNVLNELVVEQGALTIFQDNNGCLDWATGGAVKNLNKRKHIYTKQNFVMSVLESGLIRSVPVRTTKMKADLLTKPLSPTGLESVITALKLFSHPMMNC